MNKKKLLVVAMTLSLVAILAIGGTLAYFTSEDYNTNFFAIGDVNIVLDEAVVEFNSDNNEWEADQELITEDNRVKENDYNFIYPGADLPKDPTIRNVGTNDAYVRLTVSFDPYVVGHMVNMEKEITNSDGPTVRFEHLIGELGEGWEFYSDETEFDLETFETGDHHITYIYRPIVKGTYYAEDLDLADYDATTPLFTNIHVPESLQTMYDYGNWQFDFHAEAIQSDGFASAENAWAAYEAQLEGVTLVDPDDFSGEE